MRSRMTGPQRREQLLEVGRKLFADKGFEGTSVEEIAAKAGVSKPVVYEHLGGKEGLYAVVVDREIRTLLDGINVALRVETTYRASARRHRSLIAGVPVKPCCENVADIVASWVPRLKNATAFRPPLRSRTQNSFEPEAVRLPRAPRTSWLTARTSSLVSNATVQASLLSRIGLPP